MDIQSRPVITLGVPSHSNTDSNHLAASAHAEVDSDLRKLLVIHSKSNSGPKGQRLAPASNIISEQDELFASDSTKSLPEGAAHLLADRTSIGYESLHEMYRSGELKPVPSGSQRSRGRMMSGNEPSYYSHSADPVEMKEYSQLEGVAGALPKVRDCVPDYLITGRDALLQDLCKTKHLKFTDPEFPPNSHSLLGNISDLASHSQVTLLSWARIGEIFGNDQMRIYEDITPTDIMIGPLGVNYFLSAVGLLAERPSLLRRLFNSDTLNPDSVYVVWLFINGQWREIVLDDYVPIFEESDKTVSLAFSRTFEDQAWLPLLEKAYSKAYGGYRSIEGGHFAHALRDLTGAGYQVISVTGVDDHSELWSKLQESLNKNYLVGGVVKDLTPESVESGEGSFISDHTCNILNAIEISPSSDGTRHKVVQIRTISGEIEWKGLWSAESRIWTKELRERYCKLAEDEGVYWVPFEALLTQLEEIVVLHVNAGLFTNSLEVEGTKTDQTSRFCLNLEIFREGNYSISTDQIDGRLFDQSHTDSFVRLCLARVYKNGDTVEYKACKFGNSKTVSVMAHLTPGKYVILVQVYWTQSYSRLVSINCQGIQMCGLARIQLSDCEFKKLVYRTWREFVVACPGFVVQKELLISDELNSVKVKQEILDKVKDYGIIIERLSLMKGAEDLMLNRSFCVQKLSGCEVVSEINDGHKHFMRICTSRYSLEILEVNPLTCQDKIQAETETEGLYIEETRRNPDDDVLQLPHNTLTTVPTTIQDRLQRKGYVLCESKMIA